jgi:hypothetical protein
VPSQERVRDISVVQYLGEQATTDVVTGVYRHNSGPTVRMLHVMMTAFGPDDSKAESLQDRDQFAAGETRQPRHSATLTR